MIGVIIMQAGLKFIGGRPHNLIKRIQYLFGGGLK